MTGKDLGREIRNWAAAAGVIAQVGRGLWDAIRSLRGRRKTKAVRAPKITQADLEPSYLIEKGGRRRDAKVSN